MIRSETLVTVLRFYPEETDDPLAAYTVACTLMWESPTTVWVKALAGTMTRKVLREFIQHMISIGVTKVKTMRASGSLPYATKIDGYYCEIDFALRQEEFKKLLNKGSLAQK